MIFLPGSSSRAASGAAARAGKLKARWLLWSVLVLPLTALATLTLVTAAPVAAAAEHGQPQHYAPQIGGISLEYTKRHN